MSEITPITHTEKVVAGEVTPVTHLEKVIAEYGGGNVYENLEAGTNILIEETSDGKAKISASGEVSSEDTVARAAIAEMKDGTNIDSFGDVETALATKANTATTYTKTEVDTALGSKQDTISDLSTIRSGAALGATAVQPETGKGLSTNDYTTAEKTKLAGIEAQANKTTVDDALSGSSTNPVQNKVVKTALDSKANASTTYTKTEVDTALSGKQASLTTAQLAAVNSGIDSTKVAQIETNKNNILLKQDKPTASGERYNTTDTYAYYVTLTIPANRVCKVSAALSFSNSQPRGIAISQTNDSSTFDSNANLIGQKVETSTAVPQLIAEGYCSFNTEKTLYIWAKSASAASNSIFASVEYLS